MCTFPRILNFFWMQSVVQYTTGLEGFWPTWILLRDILDPTPMRYFKHLHPEWLPGASGGAAPREWGYCHNHTSMSALYSRSHNQNQEHIHTVLHPHSVKHLRTSLVRTLNHFPIIPTLSARIIFPIANRPATTVLLDSVFPPLVSTILFVFCLRVLYYMYLLLFILS